MEEISDLELWKWLLWNLGFEIDEPLVMMELSLLATPIAVRCRQDAHGDEWQLAVHWQSSDVEICRGELARQREYAEKKRSCGLPLARAERAALGNFAPEG